ncbi:MAG: exonuclease SbcCD subunit D C-terminal domain-containing protein [Bacteroidota bacterium]
MRLLHTSDWHLGQKFQHRDRAEEHLVALTWLVKTIENESIDCLIVAGDIFDIGNPPNYARRMYYRFLTALLKTSCQYIVIIGGNHDSPSMLNAPKDLLEAMNVYVLGTTTGDLKDQILELRNKEGKMEAVVAAVPFLRDKDLRASIAGETGEERKLAIRAGIRAHYQDVSELINPYRQQTVPTIAVGHLYVKGSYASEERANIYIGDTENIEADQFSDLFDYVALGHIHRAQTFKGNERVHYSGSLLPLSFSETKDDKIVKIIDIEAANRMKVRDVPVPLFRRLKTIQLPFEDMKTRLQQLHEDYKNELTVWVDAIVTDEKMIPNLDLELREFARPLNVELLKIRTTFQAHTHAFTYTERDLKDLNPLDVFLEKCKLQNLSEKETEDLTMTFKELQAWMLEEK